MPKLILTRHGQSQWNLENRFTGWWDADLTEKGEALLPTLQEICRWANRYMPETWTPPDWFMTKKPG